MSFCPGGRVPVGDLVERATATDAAHKEKETAAMMVRIRPVPPGPESLDIANALTNMEMPSDIEGPITG